MPHITSWSVLVETFNHVLFYHSDQFRSGFDFLPNASGYFAARGRQDHMCG